MAGGSTPSALKRFCLMSLHVILWPSPLFVSCTSSCLRLQSDIESWVRLWFGQPRDHTLEVTNSTFRFRNPSVPRIKRSKWCGFVNTRYLRCGNTSIPVWIIRWLVATFSSPFMPMSWLSYFRWGWRKYLLPLLDLFLGSLVKQLCYLTWEREKANQWVWFQR